MKRALIVSKNLIGDTLCAGVAIREWFRLNKENYDEVDLLTMEDHVTRLYQGLGVEWTRIITNNNETIGRIYDDVYNLGAGNAGAYCDTHKCHIIDGFCNQLEISPPQVDIIQNPFGDFKAYKPFYNPWRTLDHIKEHVEIEEGIILFSPFSASCSSQKNNQPPNKMLIPEHWVQILNYLRTLGPIRMLGAKNDMPHESWQISEEEIFTGVRLDYLAAIMAKAKLVVTIDNGMGHLAASQDAKHILFYPACLSLNFIYPWGANYSIPIQIEPTQVQAVQLLWSVRRSAEYLLGK